jgi:hypothetical protein
MLGNDDPSITLQGFKSFDAEPWDTLEEELKKFAKIFNCEIFSKSSKSSKSSKIIKPEMLKDLIWNSFRELFLTMLVDIEKFEGEISVPKALEGVFKKLFPLATIGQETEADLYITF